MESGMGAMEEIDHFKDLQTGKCVSITNGKQHVTSHLETSAIVLMVWQVRWFLFWFWWHPSFDIFENFPFSTRFLMPYIHIFIIQPSNILSHGLNLKKLMPSNSHSSPDPNSDWKTSYDNSPDRRRHVCWYAQCF